MIYFIALIPATALTVAGYFTLFLSNRSEGTFRSFGKYLGFWAFTLAGLVVLGAIFAAAHGGPAGGMNGMHGMHGCTQGSWPHEPRFFGPRDDDRGDGARPEDVPPRAPNPTPSPGPAAPSGH